MQTKDHYELKEYSMDVIRDEHDSSTCAKGRPYPIYPAKNGLNPNFLREIVSRSWPYLQYLLSSCNMFLRAAFVGIFFFQ